MYFFSQPLPILLGVVLFLAALATALRAARDRRRGKKGAGVLMLAAVILLLLLLVLAAAAVVFLTIKAGSNRPPLSPTPFPLG